MKKLLVLMLVLGTASAANAALSFYAPDMFSVALEGTLVASATEVFYVLVVSEATLSPLDATALGPAAPSMAGYAADSDVWIGTIPFSSGMTGGSWVLASAPGEAFKTGNYLTLACDYTGAPWVEAWWYEEGTGTSGLISVLTIPEPMTIALLGLGGLFVLRRRK